ncbi:MAG: formimidoylglutamase [Bacteroidia bacterium]
MDSLIYFTPSEIALELKASAKEKTLADVVQVYRGSQEIDLSEFNLVIFGVQEDRVSQNEGCALGADVIRKKLYQLFPGDYKVNILDLGNILKGDIIEDTYHAVTSVVKDCLKNKVVPIIIGGSQDLTYANYLAYEQLEQTVNITNIDSSFDLGTEQDEPLTDENFLRKIILSPNNFMFNYSAIGYQTYLVDVEQEKLMQEMYFDTFRLGQIQKDLTLAEPLLRYTDLLSVDVNSIRFSEFKAYSNPNPNGFYGEEICQLMRYAGISDKLSSAGVYGYNPLFDERETGANMVAQMLWCFIDGYYNRKGDFPLKDKADYQKFIVPLSNGEYTLSFYKSNKTDRWWIEVPYASSKLKYERHQVVPCNYEHYQIACKDEMPDIWWKTYQKLS